MGTLNYKIMDDFLEESLFKEIKKEMYLEHKMPWYYNDHQTSSKKDECYFSHLFFKDSSIYSNYYINFIVPIFNKLNGNFLLEARANLKLKSDKKNACEWHTDRKSPCYTGIYYVNTNNGYTEMCLGKPENNDEIIKIDCKENRMLVFNSNILHRAVAQTDIDKRIVINFNYH